MHRRFEGAPTVALHCPWGPVQVVLAEGFRRRFLGLMGLSAEEIEPLLFPRCRSIHTHGMRTPIDLVWLDLDEARVLEVVESLKPGRGARAPRGVPRSRNIAALELAPGEASRLGLARVSNERHAAEAVGLAGVMEDPLVRVLRA
ncbi:MAG: uncharacterized protein QOI31_2234 [Solirubrobacterales bacterium]|jgi:uncharacterized membrane protein (UPF0127 family)|nr:uncharacterized protein [Solirubrobacterales bacterium]